MHVFDEAADKIVAFTDRLDTTLLKLDSAAATKRRNSQHRNIKQIVGHLVDSATNNTHRVVHLQYQNSPCSYPDYANLGVNDKWIAIQNYNDEDWESLVQLVKYLNIHYVHVIRNIDPGCQDNVWISATNQSITLKDMVLDYPRHLQLHITEIEQLINDN